MPSTSSLNTTLSGMASLLLVLASHPSLTPTGSEENPLTSGSNQQIHYVDSGTIKAEHLLMLESSVNNVTSSIAEEQTTNSSTKHDSGYEFLNMAWPKVAIVSVFVMLILVTVIGNTLVILAVLTTRRLRTVTNCFVMNLAITDWLVGTCVMPLAVIRYIFGSWRFGWILCDVWISLDVLLCTGSILSLCAISLDRYLAVIQPLTYSKKQRSKRLALFIIFVVWVTALSITCPPFLGWYETDRWKHGYLICRYNQNKGYVVFSAMGSFFIPLAVMLYVYLKIGYVLTSRRQRIVRDAVSEKTADNEIDCDNFISETENFQRSMPKFSSLKTDQYLNSRTQFNHNEIPHNASFYELVESSRLSSMMRCSSVNCRYSRKHHKIKDIVYGRASTLPLQSINCTEGSSFSDSCLSTDKVNLNCVPNPSGDCENQQKDPQHHVHHHHHQHQQQHRVPMRVSTMKRETKTAKTLTIVMGGFIACWLPFFIYYIMIPFLPKNVVSEGLMAFLTWVGWVNCAINPFIYAFYNPDFRAAFWRLTFKKIFRTQSNHLSMFRG